MELSSPLLAEGAEADVYAYGPDKVVRIYKRIVDPVCLEVNNTIAYHLSQLPYFIGYYGITNFIVKGETKIGEIYERGETTLGIAMFEKALTIRDKISILSCLLLGLKVARDQYEFIHGDLHSGNIVLKINGSYPREVVVDKYRVTEFHYSPRIIDYGTSSIILENKEVITGCMNTNGRYDELPGFLEELRREEIILSGVDRTRSEFSLLLRELERLSLSIDEVLEFVASRYPEILVHI